MDWLRDWQELVGAALTAVTTIAIAFVAIFLEQIKEHINSKKNKRRFLTRVKYVNALLEDYRGGLKRANSALSEHKDSFSNALPVVRIPFPPNAVKYLEEFDINYGRALEEEIFRFQLTGFELERVLERNGVSMLLRLRPNRDVGAEAQVSDRSEVPVIQNRLDDAINAANALEGAINRAIKKYGSN